MKYILRVTIFIICLISMMSSVSSAAIEEEWPFGMRNPLPNDPTYVRFDFEDGGTHFNSYPGVVNFVKIESEYPLYPDKWDSVQIGEGGYHIYPKDFFHHRNGSQVDYIYIVNGERAAQPIYWWCNNVKCEWWPGSKGRIEFPTGASDVSFLISNGAPVQMKAYDKTGKYLGYSGVAYSNIERVPPNPSNFTRVSFTTEKPIIYAVEITTSQNNFWLGDDFVIGGLTFPNEPVNYTYVARRAQELHGVDYLEYGLGYDYVIKEYMDTWQFKDSVLEEYWNPETKQFELGKGISNPGLIGWAYNYDAMELAGTSFIKWSTVDGMAKHDFTVPVDPSDIQPGDVYFMNHDFDSKNTPDEIGMVIEENNSMNLITSCPDENIGVIYLKSSIVESLPAFMGYYRLPGVINGGHNPIPKGH